MKSGSDAQGPSGKTTNAGSVPDQGRIPEGSDGSAGASRTTRLLRGKFGGELAARAPRTIEELIETVPKTPLWTAGFVTLGEGVMARPAQQILEFAKLDCHLLLYGETGTGKEMAAEAVHRLSRRAEGPFVPVNCGAVPENLIESELFGHAKGAYTGAEVAGSGLFVEATGGTLFLDEIQSSSACQQKLLRPLQDGNIRPVGASTHRHVDLRIIAASGQLVKEALDHGTLRRDLYQRMVLQLYLPPLRDRPEDVPPLVGTLLKAARRVHDGTVQAVTVEALDVLMGLPWPGNVRQLKNVLERLVLAYRTEVVLSAAHLREVLAHMESTLAAPAPAGRPATYSEQLSRASEEILRDALRRTRGNHREAARLLDISERTLRRKLRGQ